MALRHTQQFDHSALHGVFTPITDLTSPNLIPTYFINHAISTCDVADFQNALFRGSCRVSRVGLGCVGLGIGLGCFFGCMSP